MSMSMSMLQAFQNRYSFSPSHIKNAATPAVFFIGFFVPCSVAGPAHPEASSRSLDRG
jgi:hypothetical protein